MGDLVGEEAAAKAGENGLFRMRLEAIAQHGLAVLNDQEKSEMRRHLLDPRHGVVLVPSGDHLVNEPAVCVSMRSQDLSRNLASDGSKLRGVPKKTQHGLVSKLAKHVFHQREEAVTRAGCRRSGPCDQGSSDPVLRFFEELEEEGFLARVELVEGALADSRRSSEPLDAGLGDTLASEEIATDFSQASTDRRFFILAESSRQSLDRRGLVTRGHYGP